MWGWLVLASRLSQLPPPCPHSRSARVWCCQCRCHRPQRTSPPPWCSKSPQTLQTVKGPWSRPSENFHFPMANTPDNPLEFSWRHLDHRWVISLRNAKMFLVQVHQLHLVVRHLLLIGTLKHEGNSAGVSIISKNLVFYKGWYLRLEFFIRRVNLVFYKKE